MNKGYFILVACMLVTFVLGSVHAFSVFIVPLEQLLSITRSKVSLIYSFALAAITVSVLFGYLIYARLSAWLLVLLTCLVAALGLIVAAIADNWWLLLLGYSGLFGIANGVGYGFTLQLSARELPEHKGFAMGAVTAAYALGSIAFAKIFASQIESLSVAAAFTALAIGLALCGMVSAMILYLIRASYTSGEYSAADIGASLDNHRVLVFWLAYMLSVFAGLMAIGHAAGIALSKAASHELSIWSAMVIGIGSAFAGFLAGWLVDRWPAPRFLIFLPIFSALVLFSLAFSQSPVVVICLLGLAGFCYGAVIAIYPVAIADEFGDLGPKAYGRVFTAWGIAGLVAPWSAGLIYDATLNYQMALIVAGITALLSALTVFFGNLKSVV